MRKVEAQIVIDAHVQQVWEVLASHHCAIVGIRIDEYITEWNEGRDFTFFVAGEGIISEGSTTWSVKPQGDNTLVHTELRYGLRFGPHGTLMNALILHQRLEQDLEKALAGLKHYFNNGESIGIPVAA